MNLARDYLSDPTFAALLAVWERDRRAPLPLVDWLLERGLDGQAEGARWAATEPDRPWCAMDQTPIGPFPFFAVSCGDRPVWDTGSNYHACQIPEVVLKYTDEYSPSPDSFRPHDTIPLALCALLDGWADWLRGTARDSG